MIKETQKQLKIGLVSNSTWYTYNFRLGLLKRLKELDFQVLIIAPRDHYSTKLIAEGFGFHHFNLSIYSKNPFRELYAVKQLKRIYKQYQLDFIFHYTAKPNIYGSLAAWLSGIPSIAITTGLGLLRDPNAKKSAWILRQLYRLAGFLAKEVWFLNKDDLQYFRKYKLLSSAKPFVLPSEGVNIQWYRPRNNRGVSNFTKIKFLFASRIVQSKGASLFYEVAKNIKEKRKDVEFQMVGFVVPEHPDGISYQEIQAWKKSGMITYLGEAEDIRPFIENADCVVLPSYFGEGVPRILLEAASMAKPIITTDFVGCKEVVEHGVNGLLCRVRDVQSLQDQIELFVTLNNEERYQMGIAGRKKAILEFDEEIIIKNYLEAIYKYLAPLENLKRHSTLALVRKILDYKETFELNPRGE